MQRSSTGKDPTELHLIPFDVNSIVHACVWLGLLIDIKGVILRVCQLNDYDFHLLKKVISREHIIASYSDLRLRCFDSSNN